MIGLPCCFFLAVEPTYLFPPENFNETVNETDSVTFICAVVGIPAPSISFYRNGTLLDQSTDQRITLTDNSEPQDFQTTSGTLFRVNRSLTLDNTMDADSGTLTCVASNAAANVTQEFELIVQGEEILYLACRYVCTAVLGESRGWKRGGHCKLCTTQNNKMNNVFFSHSCSTDP